MAPCQWPMNGWKLGGAVGAGLAGSLTLALAAAAQNAIVPDGTLGAEGSVVNTVGPNSLITGGATRGQNLFHSFEQFDVDTGGGAFFVGGADTANIFSRVTGTDPSDIFGTLGTLGTAANLYLINPNGIVFGPGAVLDVGGSFTATTASGVGFGEAGAFSAVNPQVPSGLLTVDPSAYFFSQLNPGGISLTSGLLRSAVLQVPDGENLTLLGGDIAIDGGEIVANGGRIELGAIGGIGVVGLNADGSLSFPEALDRADVTITNQAGVSSIASDGGTITITADDVAVLSSSVVGIGVAREIGQPPGQAGDLTISAAGNVSVDNQSQITNQVISGGAGNAGDLKITATNLEVTNGAQLSASTFGQGNAGDVVIEVTDTAHFDGVNPFDGSSPSSARSQVAPEGMGSGGNLQITATNLEVTNGAQLSASTFGQGDAGDVVIEVADTARFDGVNPFNGSSSSFAGSQVAPGGIGSGGNLQITATNLEVTNGAQLSASTFGQGDAGDVVIEVADTARFDGVNPFNGSASGVGSMVVTGVIGSGGNLQITATNLEVTNGAALSASTFGQGDAGDVVIAVTDTARFDGVNPFNGNASGVGSTVAPGGIGSGGNLQITATNLEVTNGAVLNASTFGQGDAGDVVIEVADTARFDGVNPFNGSSSFAGRQVNPGGIGNGGNLQLTATNLEVTNGAALSASTFGDGDAGDVVIVVTDTARFDGVNPFGGNSASFAGSQVEPGGIGSGGSLQITATNLEVTNGAQLSASTFGQGDAGDVVIAVADTARFDGVNPFDGISASFAGSTVVTGGIGSGGNLQITATNLEVTNGAQLSASTSGQGDAGDVVIAVTDTARFDGVNPFDGISASGAGSQVEPGGIGSGGNLQITATNLEVTNGAVLSASTFGQGNAGDVVIAVTDTARFDGVNPFGGISSSFAGSQVESGGIGSGGNLQITATNLEVTNGAVLSASTSGQGDAGDVVIVVTDTARFDGVNPFNGSPTGVFTSTDFFADGSGGDIEISATNLSFTNGAALSASSRNREVAGNIQLTVGDQLYMNNGTIETSALRASGGQIDIAADNILLEGDSDIQTSVFSGAGGGGNITLTADLILAFDDSDILAFSADGTGGNILLQTPAFFGQNFTVASLTADPATLDGNDRVDINATGAVSGLVSLPNTSLVGNSLANLPDGIVNTDLLLAGSCIARSTNDQGSFVVTGGGGVPTRPGDGSISTFPTDQVRGIEGEAATTWQPGDAIVEPTGVFALADGRLVLSQACE